MFRGMYSGISGMKANQLKLDVIGNNISNSGTTAFKASRARFKDMLSQNYGSASAPSQNTGGVNPSQVGLGVSVAAIDTIMSQGAMQTTSRNLDMALDGDGFFMVSKGTNIFEDGALEVNQSAGAHSIMSQSLQSSGVELMFTRDGAFTLDQQGNLVTGDGYRVLGYSLTNDDTAINASGKNPEVLSAAGFNFIFGPGAALNGYKVVLGSIGPQTVTSAEIDKIKKTIIVNGDFSSESGVTSEQVQSAVNRALNTSGIGQTVTITGKASNFASMYSERVKGGSDAERPGSVTFAGLNMKFTEGDYLNGYVIELGDIDSPATGFEAKVNRADKSITISGNFRSEVLTADKLKNIVNAALAAEPGLEQRVSEVTGTQIGFPKLEATAAANNNPDAAPTNVTIAGFNFEFPNNKYNDVKIIFNSITEGDLSVDVDLENSKSITIQGDFIRGGFSASDLLAAINAQIPEVNDRISSVKGKFSLSTGMVSSEVEGGTTLAKPDSVTAVGLEFDFQNGATLNDYIIQIGKVTAGTPTSTEVDTKNKRIILNLDLVSENIPNAEDIEKTINKSLENNGINQKISVSGTPLKVYDTESLVTSGGTPVQSIDNNGDINYVNGNLDLKSYDSTIKSLRIPEKVRVPGTDQYLRVTSFTVSKEGVISAILEDGSISALGQIATASFTNSVGLSKLGGNLYQQSVNSGEPVMRSGIGTTGEDNSSGYGDLLQGMLEMSNVDLAEQFTEMIIANRAFQASGKMITTGDELLQDIINLKR